MNNAQMFTQFGQEVAFQSKYNKNGCINAIPIVVYHNFLIDKNYIEQPNLSNTDAGLFSDEMKYLHDNGFKVLKTSDLGYNSGTNYIYIKGPIDSHMKNCCALLYFIKKGIRSINKHSHKIDICFLNCLFIKRCE